MAKNSTTNNADSQITNMSKVKIIVLQFRAEHHSGWTEDNVKKYEMEIVNEIERLEKLYKNIGLGR